MKITSWEQYKKEASLTWFKKIKENDAIEYIENKVIEELGEILGEYTKLKFNKKQQQYGKEFGDLLFYLASYENLTEKELLKSGIRIACEDVSINIKESLKMILNKPWGLHDSLGHVFRRVEEAIELLELDFYSILTDNIKKIRERHGMSYNPEYYKGC